MSYRIPVYRHEAEAGLAQAVATSQAVAYVAPLQEMGRGESLALSMAAEAIQRASAASIGAVPDSHDDPELFYMKDVLATAGWNINEDVFGKAEMWAARHTSRDKPLNFQHDASDIIGHIVAAQATDADMVPLADDLAIDDVPDKFHIVNGSVIYRMIGGEERREQIEKVIAEIRKGEWYVSMEAFFRGFDYAVRDPDGVESVVARNEKTAWLTKYLRAYKPDPALPVVDRQHGSGVYVDRATGAHYQVGRLMRNLTFCGKGLVRKPGNADSIIFASVSAFSPSGDAPVYLHHEVRTSTASEEKQAMPEAEIQAQLDELTRANKQLTEENLSLKGKDATARIASLEAEVSAKAGLAASLQTQLDTVKSTLAETVARATAAEASLATASDELSAVRAEKSVAARLKLLADKNAPEASRAELVKTTAGLSDEAFAATVEAISAAWVVAPKTAGAAAIDRAVPEPDAAMATAGAAGEDSSVVRNFISSALRTGRNTSK